jgi:exodeoxyribonuclease-5
MVEWLEACRYALPLTHGLARVNMEGTANARASLSQEMGGVRFSRAFAGDLAAASQQDMTKRQIRLGTERLLERGLLIEVEPHGANTPALYRMSIPDEMSWRLNWKREPIEPTTYSLTEEQEGLSSVIRDFIVSGAKPYGSVWPDNVLVIHGYAGTGKTTTVAQVLKALLKPEDVCFMAPSNRAASVLRDLGVEAFTIHRQLYKITGNDSDTKEPRFREDEGHKLRCKELVVIDEASMVSDDMAEWITKECRKVIVIGDPMQLPPVKGTALWTKPCLVADFELREVVRTTNPEITRASERFREDSSMTLDSLQGTPLCVPPAGLVRLSDYDVVLTYTNEDRAYVNRMLRGSGPPHSGDSIMVLENVREKGKDDFSGPDDYFNGQSLTVTRLIHTAETNRGEVFHLIECLDDRDRLRQVQVLDSTLLAANLKFDDDEYGESVPRRRGITYNKMPVLNAAYDHSVTVHKAQGSSYDRVLVINPGLGSDGLDAWRFGYTSITRAKRILTIASLDQIEP